MSTPVNKVLEIKHPRSGAQRIWVVSELYYPELTSTGYFLTGIAEGLAETYDVSVLCGQPSYWARGERAASCELRNGVDVQRCWATTLDKNKMPFKIINLITISFSIFLAALIRVRRNNVLIAVTNPPLLPYLAALVCRIRGARLVVLVHDVYPEVLTRLGVMKPESMFVRLLDRASRRLYEGADRIVVVGRDMRNLVTAKLRSRKERVVIGTNWGNTEGIVPQLRSESQFLEDFDLKNRFVVQLWGNMGRPHNVEDIVDAAQLLAADSSLHFVMIGWGTKRPWVVAEKQRRGLDNMTVLEPFPREDSCKVQNGCDIAINALSSGLTGVSVPSRSYNAMAAGKPLLAICDSDSELAAMVREEDIGWVVPPGRPDLIASALLEAKSDPGRLHSMGERARKAAETRYTCRYVLQVYKKLIEELKAE